MANKLLESRVILKNGSEENWNKVSDFIPEKGEILVYNPDETHSYSRLKIGNGVNLPKDLPFVATDSIPGLDPDNIVAKRVGHKLIFGNEGQYQYDGSEEVVVPTYNGKYNID